MVLRIGLSQEEPPYLLTKADKSLVVLKLLGGYEFEKGPRSQKRADLSY
jgi:hypothetical protein